MLWKTIEYFLSDSKVFRISGPARPSHEAPSEHDEFTFQVSNQAAEGSQHHKVEFIQELLREDIVALHRALGEFLK